MPAPLLPPELRRPALFGLCGAAAGLLGAVLVGEPVRREVPPPPPVEEPAPPRVGVSAPPAVHLYPGTANTFPVRVARARFAGPVAVKFTGLPAWVKLDPIVVPAGQTEAGATATAGPAAVPEAGRLAVTAEGGGATATAAVDLVIDPLPPPPPRLAVSLPPRLPVFRRGNCKFAVAVARAGFDGPVEVTVGPLPAGVSLPPVVVPAGATRAEVTLSAGIDAAPGFTELDATARAVVGGDVLRAAHRTELRVRNPPTTPVDVVFVLDISGGMQYAVSGIHDGVQAFADGLTRELIDVRLGLVGFRDTTLGQPNKLLKFATGETFTADVGLFREQIGMLTAGGGGAPGESSLDGLADGVDYPFRPGAARVVVLITDEPPKNPDRRVKGVADAVELLKAAKIDQLHLVLNPEHKAAFAPLGNAAKGDFFNLREFETGKAVFEKLMPELGKAVAVRTAVTPPKDEVAAAPPPPVVPDARGTVVPATAAAPPDPVLPPPPEAAAPAPGRPRSGFALRVVVWALLGWLAGVAASLFRPLRRPPAPPEVVEAVAPSLPLSLDDDEPAPLPLPPAPPPLPALSVEPRHPDACPQCGQVNAGARKRRYCLVCDLVY